MRRLITPIALMILTRAPVVAADWPTWRADARRAAVAGQGLPADLRLSWSRALPRPESCWPWAQYRLRFDASYEPVLARGLLLVGSMVRDCVSAFDARTGEERWRCYADGPVRFAPAVSKDKVYFACDDGCLYCADLATGRLRWRTRAGPSGRRLLGNGRLVCMWPARGAPVVDAGRVYFAAGIWPFMGIFVCAVDAADGRLLWRNSGSGSVYVLQPHHSPAFAGVAPQGYLALDGETLLVPGGRSVPAAYDCRDGRLRYYHPNISKAGGGYAIATRGGWFFNADIALPGAADWTQQYGDAANTVCSGDRLVRGPLGVLWFGGPSNLDVLPRHGHGPTEQVVAGRLFIEGIGGRVKQPRYPVVMSARDVYTGRVLWRREFADIDTSNMYYNGTYNPDPYDRSYNQGHMPGANQYGSNFVTTREALYLVRGSGCLALDPATGKTLRTLSLPRLDGLQPHWGYIGAHDDLLIATAAPVAIDKKQAHLNHRYGRGSKYLVVFDRRTGKVLWTRRALFNFRHNCIVAGAGTIFCLDAMSKPRLAALRRSGLAKLPAGAKPRLLALAAHNGRVQWSSQQYAFGTWLGYSAEHDVLLAAGSRSGDRARDEVGSGMVAVRGRTGERLWHNAADYLGPCIIRHDTIITQCRYGTSSARPGGAYSLLTGKPLLRVHPLTGQRIPWGWVRFYGCNTAVGGEHLMTFRSASASYIDLHGGQGAISLGGFKSGCTSNLIPAGGVLNAPDYTRTCRCAYQNQSSLALVHMPGVEQWSFDYYPPPRKPTPVLRAGLNFGAPGDRSAHGVLWLEYPSVGGPSPDFPVLQQPRPFARVRVHSCFVKGELNWVAASAIKGAGSIRIRPFLQPAAAKAHGHFAATAYDRNAYAPRQWDPAKIQGTFPRPRPYTVRLYFAELEGMRPGARVFNVRVQGRVAIRNLDIARAAGGPNRQISRELSGIEVRDDLVIALEPAAGSKALPLLSGVQLVSE